jgi:O-glycosyl hydrolase
MSRNSCVAAGRHTGPAFGGGSVRVLATLLVWFPHLSASASPTVSVRVLPSQPGQVIDGFGTCLYGSDADRDWFRALFFDDLRCSIVRIDLTPHFRTPFSDDGYNSPLPDRGDGRLGPEGGNVRTYTGPSDYGRLFAGRSAKIAVMGPDIEQNLGLFDFAAPSWKTAGELAKLGLSKKAELGSFKLVGSVWSPAPWLKLASGNRISESAGVQYPRVGTPWPFIWAGNFAGGRFDASGVARPEFDDSGLGGQGPTSALVQFARGLAAEVRGFQRTYQVPFCAISLQNELNSETYYNSCVYPQASDYVAVLKVVRREFDKYEDLRGISIVGPEDLLGDVYALWQLGPGANPTHKNLQYLAAVAGDKAAASALGFFAIHGYAAGGVTSAGTDPDQWRRWADGWRERPALGLPDTVDGFLDYGKKSWMTETSGEVPAWLAPASGFPGEGALGLAVRIHQALTAGQQSAWLYWQFSDGGDVSGMTLTDARLGGRSPKYVAAKHFFAPIRPGARRFQTQVLGTDSILASAFVHSSMGTLVVVLLNLSAAEQAVEVEAPALPRNISSLRAWTSSAERYWQESTSNVQDGRASVTLPGFGIATLLGAGELGPADIAKLSAIQPVRRAAGQHRSTRWWARRTAAYGALVVIAGLLASTVVWYRRRR